MFEFDGDHLHPMSNWFELYEATVVVVVVLL